MLVRSEKFHGKDPGVSVVCNRPRDVLWTMLSCKLDPFPFVYVARQRRVPIFAHLEFRKRSLQAKRSTGQFDQPNARRHATGERPPPRRLVRFRELVRQKKG